MKTWFIALEDAGRRPYGYKQNPGLLVVHAVKDKGFLPPYIWIYEGERQTSKTALKRRIMADIGGFMAWVNAHYDRKFTAVEVR